MPRYGRGKFEAHKLYIEYMEKIANHPIYSDMPGAFGKDGRINWQVSSGKTTSFYEYYEKRKQWWIKKANALNVPGKGNAKSRFTITARMIHPYKEKPCRLCGENYYIGYMYANKMLVKKINKKVGYELVEYGDNMVEISEKLIDELSFSNCRDFFKNLFKKRDFTNFTSELDQIKEFFLSSQYIRNYWLSPGYMGNPPDRFDGFHDYCYLCRPKKDPGRTKKNLRTYLHDRRAFEWWAEGDWNLTDALYNSASTGICDDCGERVKISPDHVGPLACGFKQVPFLIPLCNSCNSSRNRRMRLKDIKRLINYENKSGESVASWQIRHLWDKSKQKISNDDEAKELSNYLRSIQDYYLRFLKRFYDSGNQLFISSYLNPHYAFYEIIFNNLNPKTLEYESYFKTKKLTKGRKSLASRSVCIAFESLLEYCDKGLDDRKFPKLPIHFWEKKLKNLILETNVIETEPWKEKWQKATDMDLSRREREPLINELLNNNYSKSIESYSTIRKKSIEHFKEISKYIINNLFIV